MFGRSCARKSTEQDLIKAFNEENYDKCEEYLRKGMRINVLVYADIKNKKMIDFLKAHDFTWNMERGTEGMPDSGDTLPLRAARGEARGIYDNYMEDLLSVKAYIGPQGWVGRRDNDIIEEEYLSTPLIETIKYANFKDALLILNQDFTSLNTGVDSMQEYVNLRDINGRTAYDYAHIHIGNPLQQTVMQHLCDLGADQCAQIKEIQDGKRNVPEGATSVISWEPIVSGEKMVNFQDEFKYGRYYTEGNWKGIKTKGVNPFTGTPGKPIKEITRYTAKVGRSRSSRSKSSRSKSSRTRSTSRSTSR